MRRQPWCLGLLVALASVGSCSFRRRVFDLPKLVAPVSGAVTTSSRPALEFRPPTFGSIRVEVCRTRACDAILDTIDASNTTETVRPTAALAVGLYYWRVRAFDPANPSEMATSATWSFSVHTARATELDTAFGTTHDFNGDGRDDLVVAVEGSVFLYAGDATGTANAIRRWSSSGGPSEDFGAAVASGDWNGDGFADLAVGAPRTDGGGKVYVYLGKADHPDTAPSLVLSAPAASDATFGQALATSDVDHDGLEDLAVGAPGTGSGTVYLFRGTLTGVSTTPSATRTTGDAAARFGAAIVGAGDVTGDDFADLIVGAPNDRGGAGAVYVYAGAPDVVSATPFFELVDAAPARARGTAVALAGDVNDDTIVDFVVGSPGGVGEAGRVDLYFGRNTRGSLSSAGSAMGAAAGDRFGVAVAAGDFDGNGALELLVGAPGARAAFVVGMATTGALAAPAAVSIGGQPTMTFGTVVHTARYFDANDSWDVAISDPSGNAIWRAPGGSGALSFSILSPASAVGGFGRALALAPASRTSWQARP